MGWKRISIFSLLCMITVLLSAQTGLQVEQLFHKSYKAKKNAIELRIEGKRLAPYRLTIFKSLTIKDLPEEAERIERLVRQDSRQAMDKEEGSVSNLLYYGFYRFKPTGKLGRTSERTRPYRYLFYRNSSVLDKNKQEITVIYMEGFVSIEELKKMFK